MPSRVVGNQIAPFQPRLKIDMELSRVSDLPKCCSGIFSFSPCDHPLGNYKCFPTAIFRTLLLNCPKTSLSELQYLHHVKSPSANFSDLEEKRLGSVQEITAEVPRQMERLCGHLSRSFLFILYFLENDAEVPCGVEGVLVVSIKSIFTTQSRRLSG